MRVAVFSCAKYSDAWEAFFTLFRKFWPDCPYPVWLVSDRVISKPTAGWLDSRNVFEYDSPSWNEIAVKFAQQSGEPILMFLEDYFLTAPVHTDIIQYALYEHQKQQAACTRLYPCPGGDEEYGNLMFAKIKPESPYRVSTQVAIWNPAYLENIAYNTSSIWDFEIKGTKLVQPYLINPFLAWKRDVTPWPLEYICTGIVRGVWQTGAIEHCRAHGIELDLTRRPIQEIK